MSELSQAAREARNEYQRRWRARNREKTREIENRHWEKVAERAHEPKCVGVVEFNGKDAELSSYLDLKVRWEGTEDEALWYEFSIPDMNFTLSGDLNNFLRNIKKLKEELCHGE